MFLEYYKRCPVCAIRFRKFDFKSGVQKVEKDGVFFTFKKTWFPKIFQIAYSSLEI